MSEQVILYDLPSTDPCKSWSLNPLKTRLLLNYKQIPYKTEWVEYPDLAGKFKEFNISPYPPGTSIADYTIPAIRTTSGTYIMDSLPIAKYLESTYPTPSAHLSSPFLERLTAILPKAMPLIAPVFMPKVQRHLLNPSSAEYFRRTREVRFGCTLEEFENGPKGGKAAWEAVNPLLKEIAEMLKEEKGGPFFMGKDVSYADFVLVGAMRMVERVGELQKWLDVDEKAFGELYEGCRGWLERDDR